MITVERTNDIKSVLSFGGKSMKNLEYETININYGGIPNRRGSHTLIRRWKMRP